MHTPLLVLTSLLLSCPALAFLLESPRGNTFDPVGSVDAWSLLASQRSGSDVSGKALTSPTPAPEFLSWSTMEKGAGLEEKHGAYIASAQNATYASKSITHWTSDSQASLGTFLHGEREVLADQRAALEKLVHEQSALAARRHELDEQQRSLIAEMKGSGDTISIEEYFQKLTAGEVKGPTVLEKTTSLLVYILTMLLFGFVYRKILADIPYGQLRRPPTQTHDTWAFKLHEGLFCDPDPRICCCSCFCQPIRWALTASSPKVAYINYYLGIAVISLLVGLGELLSLLSSALGVPALGIALGPLPFVFFMILAVRHRQFMRDVYGLPQSTWITATDVLIWCCCAPCATMQEAMQVEFVEP